VFQKNFFRGFREVLRHGKNEHIEEFKKCDFTNIYMWAGAYTRPLFGST
jgi:hypothetical protein